MVSKYARLNSKRIAVLLVLVMALLAQSFVMAQTPAPEVEIIGTVSDMTAQSITVGTQVFDTTGTEIKAGVAVGKLVKVHAIQNTAGNWVAREIELAHPVVSVSQTPSAEQTPSPDVTVTPMPINAFEITGDITALTGTTIDVAGHTIDISNAEIKNALAVGDRVKVHVIVLNGQWIAREVESASIPVTVTVPANCVAAQPAGWVTYTVQAGDTLSSIAFGSGSSVQAIAAANCIANPSSIQVGQTLFVPKQPIIVPGNGGSDDGAGHDVNDDHGNDNSTDDHGNHSDSDDHHSDDNGSDDHGSDDGGNSDSGSSEGSSHG